MRPITLVLLAALALGAAGCRRDEPGVATPDYEVVTEATITAGDEVPAPTDEVVLTITGAGVTNDGDALVFDMATLEALGTVAYSVDDDQALGREVRFTGVLLSDLLDVAGVGGDATTLHTIALNDYSVDVPIADVEEYPVLLATKADGQRMLVDTYGPLRVVYPSHAYDLEPTVYEPRWIWQLAEVEIR